MPLRLPSRVSAFIALALFLNAGPVTALELVDSWVRAMPPGRPMTAAYLILRNDGDQTVTVTGVSSPVGEASLHATRVVDGRSRMESVAELPVAPGQDVQLAPGGLHIMLMGMAQTPREGEMVPLCLITDRGEYCGDATVRRGPPASGQR